MKIYLLIICAAFPVFAERIELDKGGDSNPNALFSELGRFQYKPEASQAVTESGSALSALLRAMAPKIKELLGYTGIFKGNCSVFFRESINSAACDIKPADAREVSIGSEVTGAKHLPAEYQYQITLSHILLASVFADWRHGKLYEFDTGLYFKQDTCTLSASLSESETFTSTPRLTPMPTVAPTVMPTSEPTLVPTSEPTFEPTPAPLLAQTLCSTPTVPNATGLLAAWDQTSGVYNDVTNQTGRYNVSAGVVTDTLTNMQWEQAVGSNKMNWTDAIAYCVNQTTGGLTGWRLPNAAELESLVDYTIPYQGAAPGINTTAFSGTPLSYFWSSTPVSGVLGQNWYVSYGKNACYSGLVYAIVSGWSNCTAGQPGFVRCVRSCYPVPPASRYTVAAGDVTDSVTGLIWQQASPTTGGPSSNGKYSQSAAIGYCTGLGLNGHTWRLPSIRELATLIDYSVNQGSLMMNSAFAGPAAWYWSSTALAGVPTNAWYVSFSNGGVNGGSVTLNYFVRCVR